MTITIRTFVRVTIAAATIAAAAPAHAQPQDTLDRVRALYASAAYEDALSAISSVPDSATKPDFEVYRISCLVALGRSAEAQRAVEGVVNANPLYQPDAAEASPRIQELFKGARKQLLPGIARRLYADAKAALDRKEQPAAVKGFTDVLKLLDEPDAGQSDLLAELRLLATGFLDLSRALPAPAPATPPPPTPASAPAAAGPAPAASDRAMVTPDKPAEPIRQTLPSWQPQDRVSGQFGFKGAVKVTISPQGTVDSAVMVRSVHRSYDALLLSAARGWLYKPATKDGVPVASEKTVQIELKPSNTRLP